MGWVRCWSCMLSKERLKVCPGEFCTVIGPYTFDFTVRCDISNEFLCGFESITFLAFRKYTNTAPEKSSVKPNVYLNPSLASGSMGPAKSVCTRLSTALALASGCLFLLWANLPRVHTSVKVRFINPTLNFHPLSDFFQLWHIIIVSVTKCFVPCLNVITCIVLSFTVHSV